MVSIGHLAVILYMVSVTIIMYALYFPNIFVIGLVIGTILFLIATTILGLMIISEKKNEFNWLGFNF